jgi:hypothetical protein
MSEMLIVGPPGPSRIGPVVEMSRPLLGSIWISELVSTGGGGGYPPPVIVEAKSAPDESKAIPVNRATPSG